MTLFRDEPAEKAEVPAATPIVRHAAGQGADLPFTNAVRPGQHKDRAAYSSLSP